MHPNFHQFLYDFFITGLDLDHIASKYESSWYEVAEVVDSETARRHMHAAIRAERLRGIAQNLASRRAAIRTLEHIIHNRDKTPSGYESRRRAADAILRGTISRGRSAARPKTTRPVPACPPPSSPPQPEKQITPTHRESVREPTQSTPQAIQVARAPDRAAHTSQPVRPHQPDRSTCRAENSS